MSHNALMKLGIHTTSLHFACNLYLFETERNNSNQNKELLIIQNMSFHTISCSGKMREELFYTSRQDVQPGPAGA